MPAPTINKANVRPNKPKVITQAEQDKVAKANLLRAQSRAKGAGVIGWLIRGPAYGTPLGDAMGKETLAIHRHIIIDSPTGGFKDEEGRQGAKFHTYEGKNLIGSGCEWFTTDRDAANFCKDYWGKFGYTVTEVRNDNSYGLMGSDAAAYQRAKAIVSGELTDEDLFDDDLPELDTEIEPHPEAPKIVTNLDK